MVTNVADFARNAEISKALEQGPDAGFSMGEGDTGIQIAAHTGAKFRIYSMIDGEPRDVLRIDAERVLKKRLQDGRPAFWAEGMSGNPPEYKRGSVKCFMHPEFDEKDGPAEIDRAWIDSIGLTGRTCNMSDVTKPNKADFRSVYDRDAHMRRAHRDELRIIEAAKDRAQRQREAEDRRLDREAMLALAQSSVQARQPVAEAAPTWACDKCDRAFDSEHGRNVHRQRAHL